jgi:hypothetical protein
VPPDLHQSIDVIFRLSFLVTVRQRLSQRPTLGEQLIPRFLEVPHMVLGHDHLSRKGRPFDSNGAPHGEEKKRLLLKKNHKRLLTRPQISFGLWLGQTNPHTGDGDERSNIFGSD